MGRIRRWGASPGGVRRGGARQWRAGGVARGIEASGDEEMAAGFCARHVEVALGSWQARQDRRRPNGGGNQRQGRCPCSVRGRSREEEEGVVLQFSKILGV